MRDFRDFFFSTRPTDTAPAGKTAPPVALLVEAEVVTGPEMTKLLKSSLNLKPKWVGIYSIGQTWYIIISNNL